MSAASTRASATRTGVRARKSSAASRGKSATTSPRKNTGRVNQSDIQPRKMDFQFDADIPRYWFDNDQFKSLLLTALSCTFPEGERFFVRSVRHYQRHIRDPLLKEQVKGFIGQEAHHGNAHETFNALMRDKGLPTDKVEAFVLQGLQWMGKHLSPERQLAKTCALEHFTAMLAEAILNDPDFLDGMDERLLPLWLWHAVEESEHKAVAFDVYQDQVGSYWVRTSEMAVTTLEFTFFTTLHYMQLRRGMGVRTDVRSVLGGFNWLLGRPGLLRQLTPRWLDYFRRDFHPSRTDSREARHEGLWRLAAMLQKPELLDGAALS